MLTFSIVFTPLVTEIPASKTAMKWVSNGHLLSYNDKCITKIGIIKKQCVNNSNAKP